jgi:hypothetical protein
MEEQAPHSMPHAKGVQIGDGNVQYNVSGHEGLRLALDDAAYSTLTELLSALPAVADVALLFRAAGGAAAGGADAPADPQRCVDRLRTYVDAYPLFAFVEHLAAGCRDPMRRQLRAWVDDNIGEVRQPERRRQLASARADADRAVAGPIPDDR